MKADPANDIITQLAGPEQLWQVVIVGGALLAALLCGWLLHGWRSRFADRAQRQIWQLSLADVAVAISPYVLLLLVILIAHALYSIIGLDNRLLNVAMQLATALLLVRFGIYMLRQLLGPKSWVHQWEGRLTLLLWLAFAFQLVGWFEAMEAFLDSIDLLPGKAVFSLWSLIKGVVVVTGFVVITSIISRAIETRVMTMENVAMSTRIGITKFTYFFLVSLGVLLGINAAGVDLTTLTVLTGALGFGLGFGLQAIASNFVSGFVLLMDKSIKPGDVISFTGHTGTSTENFGWVQELRGRYVVVRDRDGVDTLVPNQHLITNPVINWSYSDRRVRLKLPVRISYRDDPELALRVLVDATEGNTRVLHEPPPVSRLMQFSENGMDLELRFWISDPQNGVNNVRSDVNRAIWRLFRQHNITIPVAQQEIHMRGGDRETPFE